MDDLAERLTEFSRAGTPRGADTIWRAAHRRLRRRQLARTTALAATAVGLVAVVVAVIAAVAVHDQRPPAPPPHATTARLGANPQEQAAIALGEQMLDKVALPAGSKPFTGPEPAGLHAPLEFPGTHNLVYAHRVWTVPGTPHAVWQWLQAHVPHGFVVGNISSGGNLGGPFRTFGVEVDLAVVPRDVSEAQLQFGIGGESSDRSVVQADTVVGWTKPRPTDEFVPTTDRTVTVSVVRISPASPANGTIGKRVSTSDPTLVQPIVQTFNALHVTPPAEPNPGGPPGCGTVLYRVAFSATLTARPDVVATVGRCGGVDVTVNGRASTGLDDLPKQEFAADAAHILGFTDPHFG
ncbi:MAG: hypothetical protein ACLPVY_12575 [Acidimicrobiia bacterium]